MHHAYTKTSLAASIQIFAFPRPSYYIVNNVIRALFTSGNGFHYIDAMIIKTSTVLSYPFSPIYLHCNPYIYSCCSKRPINEIKSTERESCRRTSRRVYCPFGEYLGSSGENGEKFLCLKFRLQFKWVFPNFNHSAHKINNTTLPWKLLETDNTKQHLKATLVQELAGETSRRWLLELI